jgi:hypothetical protein
VRQRDREMRDRDGETERQRNRETERQRDREAKRHRETEIHGETKINTLTMGSSVSSTNDGGRISSISGDKEGIDLTLSGKQRSESRDTEREMRDRETERQRDRETERQRDRETEGQRDRETERH